MIGRRTFILASAASLAGCRQKATGFPGYAFVANQDERSVTVVDLMSFAVARQIRLEHAPRVVMVDGRRGLVYALAPQNGTIYESDIAGLEVKRKLALGGTALSMRLADDAGSLWVLSRDPHQLIRVALENLRIRERLALPAAPDDFDLTADGRLAAITLPEARSVAIVDLANRKQFVAPAGGDPRLVHFRSDARQILVANRSERMLTIVDTKAGAVVVRLPLPVEPEHFCAKADGGQVFITGKGMDAVVVVHPYQTEVFETVLAGKAPGAMAISPAQRYLLAANPEPGDVTVLEVVTRTVIAAVKVGQEPCFVTFTPDDQYALVVNHRSGDLAVIRLAAIRQSRAKTAPLFNLIPVGAGPVSAAVARV